MPSSFVRTTTDVDEFRAMLRPANGEYTLTGRGNFAAGIARVELHQVRMQQVHEATPRTFRVEMRSNRVGMSFAAQGGPALVWSGSELRHNEVALHQPDEDHWHTLPAGTHWAGLSLPLEILEQNGPAVAGHDLIPKRGAVSIAVHPPALTRLRRLHKAVAQLADTAPEIIRNPEAARGLDQLLMEAMVACLGEADSRHDTSSQRRHAGVIERLRTLAREHSEEALYLPEVCKAVGVTERTLLVCCQEQLGVSPKRYLLLRRLHLVRRALRAAEPSNANVTEIVTQFGFWELGRFAAYYKQLFGESPSETLRRAPA